MTEIPTILTIPALLAKCVATWMDRDAIATSGETISFAELDRRSARMARGLLAIGAGKGTRIALLAPDGIGWLTTFHACVRIGAVVAPVSTLATPSELAYVLRHCDAQILIGVRRLARHDYAQKLITALPGLAEGRAAALRLRDAPYLRSIWLDDGDGLDWAGTIDDLAAQADVPDAPDDALLAEIEKVVMPSDDALIVYTSGSTSLPKAVLHNQHNMAKHAQVMGSHFNFDKNTRILPVLPLFWVGGLNLSLYLLIAGGLLVYPDGPSSEAALDAMERFEVNNVHAWGPQQRRLHDAAIARGMDVSQIEGFAPRRDKQGREIPPHLVANMLGMTESFGPHSSEPENVRLPDKRAGSSGRATSDFERRAIDPETGKEVAIGEVGELHLRGGSLMTGYYKRLRSEVFTSDGFYPTNDLIHFDSDGYLYFHGRQGDMFKSAGVNISRLEVQAALSSLPEVELSIVVGLPDPEIGQLVLAAVIPAEGTDPTEETLKGQLRQRLSSYKIPRRIIFLSAQDVKWTPSNKVKLAEMEPIIAAAVARTPPPRST